MLNLTNSAVVLIAESGETTSYEPSGYVARVETMRRVADHFYFGANGLKYRVPIIEEAPTEIFVCDSRGKVIPNVQHILATHSDDLLLVTREVAEAAATPHYCSEACSAPKDYVHDPTGRRTCANEGSKHPLWRRMVWAQNDEPYSVNGVELYRALRRVPQGGST